MTVLSLFVLDLCDLFNEFISLFCDLLVFFLGFLLLSAHAVLKILIVTLQLLVP
jgi:hypothetical protein